MKFSMKFLLVLSAFAIAACDSDNNNNNQGGNTPQGPFGKLQVVHASPDAPLVNLLVDGAPSGQDIPYGAATIEGNFEVGTYSVQVDAVLPGGVTAPVIGPADVAISADTITTVVALGPVAIPLDFAIIEKPDTDPAAGNARLFVLHATSGPGGTLPVDVFVTAPGADLTATAPTGTFDFKETLGPVEVPAGDYQVRVTLAGDPAAVAYDSGTVTLNDGDDLTVAAIPNVKGGPAAVQLLALGPGGSAEVLDVNTPTGLRVGHLSPDTGAVDVLVNGGIYLDDVTFPAITGIAALPADTYTVSITDGTGGAIYLPDTELALDAGTVYSVLATDFFSNLTVDILSEDDPRPVALYAKVRIIHAAPSPAAESVDIYLLDPALMGDVSGQTPAYSAVPFGANTGYAALPAGDYDVVVTVAGTSTVAISASISIADGGVYTAIARDPEPGSQEFGLEVVVDVLDEQT